MVSIHFTLGLNTKVITIPLIVNELADYFVHNTKLSQISGLYFGYSLAVPRCISMTQIST